MGVTQFQIREKCDECGVTATCRHSGARWICLGCWPKVFDGTVKADTFTMGPGEAA
jgi:ribosomal protein L37AE/L43A